MLLGYNYLSAQVWTQAPANPPANNTAAPINVGPTTQNKQGTLTSSSSVIADRNVAGNILAAFTEVRSNRYCDALGQNCFSPNLIVSTSSDTDTITVGGRCFEPANAVKCNWNWSGDGNDDSTYIVSLAQSGRAYCASVNRSFVSEKIVLAECFSTMREWKASAWVTDPNDCRTVSGTTVCSRVRTLSCHDGNGQIRPNSECTSEPPATRCAGSYSIFSPECPA